MRFIAADFSSIEGRVTAWLAGEAWKLAAFRAADAGEGPGMYELTAAGIFDVAVDDVTKGQRQVGKVAELALGYQGGVMAFDSMAKGYRLDMATAYEPLVSTAPAKTIEQAEKRYEVCLASGTTGADVLTREQWLASEITKVMWRAKHPATVALWEGLETAAHDAVAEPGTVQTYNGIRYVVRRGFLWCQLPSGRCLAYGAPRLSERVWIEWIETGLRETMAPADARKAAALGEVKMGGRARSAVSALGVDSQTKKWRRFGLYAGLLCENNVQGIARDLMAEGMLAAEEAGYPIILTVHDEALAEVPDGFGSVEDFEKVLCTRGAWAADIPVVASGYAAKRYRKDG